MQGGERVRVVEVGPRDGLQNLERAVPTERKVELVERLAACGFHTVETTSFVSPSAVPQLADGGELMAQVGKPSGVRYAVLVPNMRGYEAARASGKVDEVALFTAASETFSQRNVNASIAQTVARFGPVVEAARADGITVRGYVSMAFGSPFDESIEPPTVHDVCSQLLAIGVEHLSIGDTIGVAVPRQVRPVLEPLLEMVDDPSQLGMHMHDTRGTALANVWEGLQAGVRCFDSSVAGLGGCPFAPGASGNLASEDLVWFLHANGFQTGVDLTALLEVARWCSEITGAPVAGHMAGVSSGTGQEVASGC